MSVVTRGFWASITPSQVATFVAGFLALVVSVIDTWLFHNAFGTNVDVGLLWGGLGLMAGTAFPTAAGALSAAVASPKPPE